jgi:hypothetical protein
VEARASFIRNDRPLPIWRRMKDRSYRRREPTATAHSSRRLQIYAVPRPMRPRTRGESRSTMKQHGNNAVPALLASGRADRADTEPSTDRPETRESRDGPSRCCSDCRVRSSFLTLKVEDVDRDYPRPIRDMAIRTIAMVCLPVRPRGAYAQLGVDDQEKRDKPAWSNPLAPGGFF